MPKNALKAPFGFYKSLIDQIKTNKKAFAIFLILRLAVVIVIIRCIFEKRYECVFTGLLALLLLLLPAFVEKQLKIELPTVLETIAYFFVFCAEILGEIASFYTRVPFWDTMLHTTSGFIFAAFGFCLFDILNSNKKFKFELSPVFLALTAFCFSMTVGVLWEFFEFGIDCLFNLDMQKDFVINNFGSVYFDPKGLNTPILIDKIEKTVIYTANGQQFTVSGGYLDVGIYDTMKDLLVNFVGAVIFSLFGFVYVKHRGKGAIARSFIPVLKSSLETDQLKTDTDSGSEVSASPVSEVRPEISDGAPDVSQLTDESVISGDLPETKELNNDMSDGSECFSEKTDTDKSVSDSLITNKNTFHVSGNKETECNPQNKNPDISE